MIKIDRSVVAPEVLTRKEGIGDRERLANAEFAVNGHLATSGTPILRGFRFQAYKEKSVKEALEKLFGGKCAYCETVYEASTPADVEHWRPKGAVITADGRRLPRGYYWLASEWTNLFPSCPRCNREETHILLPNGTTKKIGKANHFPLADEARRATSPEMVAQEEPLLLDPCVDSPEEHLEFFEKDGVRALLRAKGNSVRGQASIDIYALNRAGLVHERQEYLGWIEYVLKDLRGAMAALEDETRTEADKALFQQKQDDALLKLRELRMPDRRFCALARAMIDPELAALGLPPESPAMTAVTTAAPPASPTDSHASSDHRERHANGASDTAMTPPPRTSPSSSPRRRGAANLRGRAGTRTSRDGPRSRVTSR